MPPQADIWDDMGDVYAAADAVAVGWDVAPSSIQAGRLGGGCFRLTSSARQRSVPSGVSRTVGFAWRPNSSSGSRQIFSYNEGGTIHVLVTYNGDGTLTVSRAGSALTGGTSGLVIPTGGAWYTFELAATIHDTTGAFELRIDGVTACSGSGVDTRNGGTGVIGALRLNGAGAPSDDFDDLWSAPSYGDWGGDLRVACALPNSDDGVNAWTPSTGSAHYAVVDETTPNGDTDYLSSSTPGQRDVFGFPALPVGSGAAVAGVMVRMWARKDDAGTRTIDAVARIGGTNHDGGAALALSTSYQGREVYWLDDPSTAADWTVSGVNGANLGIKEVA